jgi:hypothetical protein
MRKSIVVPAVFLLITAFLSGCIDSDVSDRELEDGLVGTPFEGSETGSGYLEEEGSKVVFSVTLGDLQFLTHFRIIVNWEDEPPLERAVPYQNHGDTFSVRIFDGDRINKMSSDVNMMECEGRTYTDLEGDLVQNDSVSRPAIVSAEITLLHCGDQYPYYYQSETLKEEDPGNDFRWTVYYRYVDLNL